MESKFHVLKTQKKEGLGQSKILVGLTERTHMGSKKMTCHPMVRYPVATSLIYGLLESLTNRPPSSCVQTKGQQGLMRLPGLGPEL